MKKEEKLGFADYLVQKRKIKREFFNQINQLIDWCAVCNIINKHYQKGASATGRPSYEGIVLFKMALLQTWYGLSDYKVEDRVNDSISFSGFVGISLDNSVPDHSVINRFRTELTDKGVYEKLFKAINKQLEKHKTGYGYKKHYVTDTEGLVLGGLTTAANVNEIANMEEILSTAETDLVRNCCL